MNNFLFPITVRGKYSDYHRQRDDNYIYEKENENSPLPEPFSQGQKIESYAKDLLIRESRKMLSSVGNTLKNLRPKDYVNAKKKNLEEIKNSVIEYYRVEYLKQLQYNKTEEMARRHALEQARELYKELYKDHLEEFHEIKNINIDGVKYKFKNGK